MLFRSIYAKAYGQDKNFYAFYRSLDAYRTAFAGRNTTFLLSPDSTFFQFFNSPTGSGPAGSGSSAAPANPPGSPPPR